jgi:hypothetical protein
MAKCKEYCEKRLCQINKKSVHLIDFGPKYFKTNIKHASLQKQTVKNILIKLWPIKKTQKLTVSKLFWNNRPKCILNTLAYHSLMSITF